VLLWPAFSVLVLAVAYLFLGPGVYRKQQGHIPWSARLLLWPALLGQHLSLLYYSRQCRAYDRLTSGLLIGRRLSSAEARAARVVAVVDLTAEFAEPDVFRALPYLSLPTLDLTAPTLGQIDQAIAFIDRHASSGTVYLHCKIGYSRTAAVAGAYLMATGAAAAPGEAIVILRAARPQMIIRSEAVRALEAFWQRRNGRIKG
jgi:protein-tyrosine phosphatase